MNPLTNVKNINKLNETELSKGTVNKKSWHDLYKHSAWIFIGGLAYGLTEGDILCVFSQYGEIVNLNHVRDKKTGKTKGFCFLCYANQKSTILAVDNLNGIKLCNRTIRVDHVANYKPPKDNEHDDEITKMLKSEGCAPKPLTAESSADEAVHKKKHKKHKKEKRKHKKRKREDSNEGFSLSKVKKERIDEGYSKYEFPEKSKIISRKKESTDSESCDDSSESDSTHIPRKEKHKSHKSDKNYQYTDEKLSRIDKSKTNKYEHRIENSKCKLREDNDSSSESDNHSNRKRKSPHVSDCSNGLSSERRDLKQKKHKGRNSDECSDRHKMNSKNQRSFDCDARNTSLRQHRHDGSSGSEQEINLRSSRTTSKDRRKRGRRDSVERERNSYKDRKQHDPHDSYRDHKGREFSHKTNRHRERGDYIEKYEQFDKNRDSKREYGKHSGKKE